MPSRCAARHSRGTSPTGSAAATSRNCRDGGGRALSWVMKLRSRRLARGAVLRAPGAVPKASSVGVSARGNSRRASGLPWDSARMRSRTRESRVPGTADSSSAAASSIASPRTRSSGSPASLGSSSVSRTAKTRPTGSAASRRATNSSVWAEAWSSHCASSTTQIRGCSSATSDRRVSTARPSRKRSGAAARLQAEYRAERLALRDRQRADPVQVGAAQLVQAGVRELQLRLNTRRPANPASLCAVDQELEQGGLADPGLATQDQNLAAARLRGRYQAAQGIAFFSPPPQPRPEPAIGHASPPNGANAHLQTPKSTLHQSYTGIYARQGSATSNHPDVHPGPSRARAPANWRIRPPRGPGPVPRRPESAGRSQTST